MTSNFKREMKDSLVDGLKQEEVIHTSDITFRHNVDQSGLVLNSTATDGVNTIDFEVIWKDTQTAARKRQSTMEDFERRAVKMLEAGPEVRMPAQRQKGKRLRTPWGHLFFGFTLGGDFDILKLPHASISKEKQGVFVGWGKLVLFCRGISRN